MTNIKVRIKEGTFKAIDNKVGFIEKVENCNYYVNVDNVTYKLMKKDLIIDDFSERSVKVVEMLDKFIVDLNNKVGINNNIVGKAKHYLKDMNIKDRQKLHGLVEKIIGQIQCEEGIYIYLIEEDKTEYLRQLDYVSRFMKEQERIINSSNDELLIKLLNTSKGNITYIVNNLKLYDNVSFLKVLNDEVNYQVNSRECSLELDKLNEINEIIMRGRETRGLY